MSFGQKVLLLPVFAVLAACDGSTDPMGVEEEAAAAAAVVSADECRGTLGAVTVEVVIVPRGASCVLLGTRVQSNVYVHAKARLRADGAIIDGNIQAENARRVVVRKKTFVGGSIQIVQGLEVILRTARVDGDIQVESNTGPVDLQRNRVGGSMQVMQNTGGVSIIENRVAQNLQCKSNSPHPTGFGNIAGSKEDQCASL